MLRRATLVLIKRLKRNSSPSSRSWERDSTFSNWVCRLFVFSNLLVWANMHDCNSSSSWANSLSSANCEQPTFLVCISLETKLQLFDFDCVVPEINWSSDWNVDRVITSTLSNKLTNWLSLFADEMLQFFLVPFKFAKAFEMAFFTTFLEIKNFLTSALSSTSPPFLLLITDWSSRMHSFVCNRESLAAVHTSKSLKDPFRSSSTRFSWHSWWSASWERERWNNFSTHSCRSCNPPSLWLRDEEEEEVSLEDLNLSKCSLHCRMRGCGLEGKLFERTWKWDCVQMRGCHFSLGKEKPRCWV